MSIRNSAKAVIVKDGRLLLTRNRDRDGFFYLFPGGGQEKGEELRDAVVRECLEEIGREVVAHDLICLREYIGANHEFAEWDGHIHQVEFYFRCELKDDGLGDDFGRGSNPDQAQDGVEWIELDRLDRIRLYPRTLGNKLRAEPFGACYIGDAN